MYRRIKQILVLIVIICSLIVPGCGEKSEKIEGNRKTYYEMGDGTWSCDDISYEFRLEIKGRLNNAEDDTVYVYLSNLPEITFEQAWKASGLSSDTADYFEREEAVLVDVR